MQRPFRVRSAQRDTETDRQRIGSVVQAMDAAVASAQNERDALRDRVRHARDLASFAVGTNHDEYLTRETKDEARIREYEQQMTNGEQRIQQLDQEIANLTMLQNLARGMRR